MHFTKLRITCLFCVFSRLCMNAMGDGNESPRVKVAEGLVQGRYCVSCGGRKYASFQGIPYAKPPLGNLRFMPPKPAEKWTGVKNATKEGPDCYAKSLFSNTIVGSEDCLYLNVYTPQIDSKKRLPVMFWIHGGGFVRGSGSSELFGPDYLVENNVVLITINFRLGHLGFLAFPNPEVGVTGNAGLKDIVLALRWVKKNVGHFGGDPNNVTIFGESAGGSAVHLLVLSPKTKGLFHKAILQSGTALNNFSRSKFAYTYEVARNLGIESNSDKLILSELQKVSIDELSQACYKIRDPYLISHMRPFCPVIEPKTAKDPFLTEEPLDIIKSGRYNKVPMIMGYNSFEGIFFYTYIKHPKNQFLHDFSMVPHTLNLRIGSPSFKIVTEKVRKVYDIKGNESKEVADDLRKALMLYGHNSFAADVYRSAKLHCESNRHPVYFYRLNLDTQLNFVKRMSGVTDEGDFPGAAHGDDIGYLFPNNFTDPPKANTLEYNLIRKMVKLWTNFAYHGNPTENPVEEIKIWKPVTLNQFNYLSLDNDEFRLLTDPDKKYMEFWDKVYLEHQVHLSKL